MNPSDYRRRTATEPTSIYKDTNMLELWQEFTHKAQSFFLRVVP